MACVGNWPLCPVDFVLFPAITSFPCCSSLGTFCCCMIWSFELHNLHLLCCRYQQSAGVCGTEEKCWLLGVIPFTVRLSHHKYTWVSEHLVLATLQASFSSALPQVSGIKRWVVDACVIADAIIFITGLEFCVERLCVFVLRILCFLGNLWFDDLCVE